MKRPPRLRERLLRTGSSGVLSGLMLLLVASSAARSEPAPSFEDPAARTRTTVLENGLTVLTLEDHTTPVVSFQIWVQVGSGDEARWTGIAHLFEHMMFRGSERLPPEAHGRLIGERGGRVNAFTSRDVTVYFDDVTSEHLPLVVELEAERLRSLDISEESLESERQVVIEERRLRSEDDPQGRAFENLLALAFQAHPYRIPTVGWMSDLEKIGVEECNEFFRDYYAANNLVVAVAGDFDTEELLALIRKHMGPLRSSDHIARNPQLEPEQRGERRAVVHFDVRAPILAAAWHAPPTGHEDGAALDVLSSVLSSGRTSRLYRTLVYDEQAALGASGAYWELMRAGLFYAFAIARPGVDIGRVESLFFGEVDRIATEGVTQAEVDKAKRTLEVDLIEGLGTAHALASRIGRDMVSFGRIRPLEERLSEIRSVTPEDVQRVAATWLKPEKRNVVHVTQPPEASQ
ncbi:MAG: pitrilysin family protein [Myxococcota bacterium]|nr:pitrilysin family protein [Myxococcota bacterium]